LLPVALVPLARNLPNVMLQEYHPRKLIIFSRDELKQHEMRMSGLDHPSLRYFIADVRDCDRLRRAMNSVDIGIYAAALKQGPSCEDNPFEAIRTNILGGQHVVEAAIDRGVQKVMALSTDKAVNPINLYGASKLCAEKLSVQGNAYSGEGCCTTDNPVNVRHGPARRGDIGIRKNYSVVNKARETLSWELRIVLRRGLELT
jgi:FlaA1/EpsC-like NDP-sugar epimerase